LAASDDQWVRHAFYCIQMARIGFVVGSCDRISATPGQFEEHL
jgi:hypothetical protein